MLVVERRLLASSGSIARASRTAVNVGLGNRRGHGATRNACYTYNGAEAMKKWTPSRVFQFNQSRTFLSVARKFWALDARLGSAARHRFCSSSGGLKPDQASQSQTFWQKFLGPKPMPERRTAAWYREMLLICTVFGITGSSTMIVRFSGKADNGFVLAKCWSHGFMLLFFVVGNSWCVQPLGMS